MTLDRSQAAVRDGQEAVLQAAFDSGWCSDVAATRQESEQSISDYFTRQNFVRMFGECNHSDAELEAMADAVRSWRDDVPVREAIMIAADGCRSNDVVPEDLIRAKFNCRDVDIDGGDVWIADPQVGHWLNDDDLADALAALRGEA